MGERAASHTGMEDTLPASPAEQGGREITAHKVEATSKGDSARDVAGRAKSAECWVLGACVGLAAGYS